MMNIVDTKHQLIVAFDITNGRAMETVRNLNRLHPGRYLAVPA